MSKSFNLKLSLGLQEKANPYSTEAGNGKKIKKYYWDEKNKITKQELDKDGKPIYDNLYEKIQWQTESTNYKKFINKNSSINEIKMIFETKNPYEENYLDATKIGDTEQMKKTENQINATFGNQQNFQNFTNQKIMNYQNQINKYKQYLKKQQEIAKAKALLKEAGESK